MNAIIACPPHTGIAKNMKVDDAITDALRNETPLPSVKLETLRDFTLKLVRNRGNVSDADIQLFFDAGYENRQILEIVLGIAQKVMSNYTNHLAQTPIDSIFQKLAWTRAGA